MRRRRILGIVGVLVATSACLDMDIENINAPDQERALTEPSDVEALIGTGFYRWVNGSKKDAMAALAVAGNEITSSWGNFGMQNAGTLPRGPWDNSPTASYRALNQSPWSNLYEGLSNMADGLLAVDRGMTFESEGQDTTDRARAYARFTQGVITGYLALLYDQVFIFDETVLQTLEEVAPGSVPYQQAMDKAMAYFDDAIAIASSAAPFTLPGGSTAWIHGATLDNQELIQWTHSFAAVYLASVARTPAERAQVDWNRVLFHLDRGVTEIAGMEGPQDPIIWWCRPCERPEGWIRTPYDLIGPADESGRYQAWLATNPLDREPFLLETSDRRIHAEDGSRGSYMRTATPFNVFPSDRGQYFQSAYFIDRFHPRHHPDRWDVIQPLFLPAVMDLWRAEAVLRLGQRNEAIDLINNSRVGNGELPPLPYDASDMEVWSTLHYEKLLEQAQTMGSMVFFDRRGFGTLTCGTPLHYPVPGVELEVMLLPNYTFGGGGEASAAQATGCRNPDEPGNVPHL